jgi:hypothetical protein
MGSLALQQWLKKNRLIKQANQADSSELILLISTWCRYSEQYMNLKSYFWMKEWYFGMINRKLRGIIQTKLWNIIYWSKCCDSRSRYICIIEVYIAKGRKLEYTFHSVDDNLELKHHMDQYNYNNVKAVEASFGQGTKVCTKQLKREESTFQSRKNILL